MSDPWPLRHLVLRPDDDNELAALARRGVHPPQEMPFLFPWTDQDPEDLMRRGFGTEMRAAGLLLAFALRSVCR